MQPAPDLEALRDAFLEHCAALRYSPTTLASWTRLLNAFLTWLRIERQVHTAEHLRVSHLEAYQLHLHLHRTRDGLPLAANTVNAHVRALRNFLRYLAERRHLPKDLPERIAYVKVPKTLPTSVLTHAQVRHVLDHLDTGSARGYRDRTILELLYTSAIRAGELVGLDCAHIDLHNAALRVHGKGNKDRVAPIGKTACRFLTVYLKAVRPFWPGAERTAALFLNLHARPLTQKNLNDLIQRLSDSTDIGVAITPHTFRRSCATELIRGDANVYHVKELLGHSDLRSLAPYTKLTIGDLKATHRRCHPRERDGREDAGG